MTKSRILFFDIETTPCDAWVWSTGKQRIGPEQIISPSKIICICYKFSDEKTVHSLEWDTRQNDKKMLAAFSKVVDQAEVIVGHNGKNFDVRHINARIAYHGLAPLTLVMIEDTLKQSRAAFRVASHSLNYLGQYFDLGEKVKTGGIDLWLDVWKKNDEAALAKMVKYCKGDVLLLEKVYNRILPYVKSRVNQSSEGSCPSCGHNSLKKHGFYRASALRVVQRYRCIHCGKTSQGGHNLIKKTVEKIRE